MTDFSAIVTRALAPREAREGRGVDLDQPADPTELLDQGLNARTINAAIRQSRSVPDGTLVHLARQMGAAYFTGTVTATPEVAFPHDLGRIPAIIVMSVAHDGDDGRVIGTPGGGGPGLNSTAWSSTQIWVRATRTARYSFLVL